MVKIKGRECLRAVTVLCACSGGQCYLVTKGLLLSHARTRKYKKSILDCVRTEGKVRLAGGPLHAAKLE